MLRIRRRRDEQPMKIPKLNRFCMPLKKNVTVEGGWLANSARPAVDGVQKKENSRKFSGRMHHRHPQLVRARPRG